jgi:hypothetical protein
MGERDGSESGGGSVVRGIGGTGGKVRDSLGRRARLRGAFVRIDSMYQPGGLIGAVRPAG